LGHLLNCCGTTGSSIADYANQRLGAITSGLMVDSKGNSTRSLRRMVRNRVGSMWLKVAIWLAKCLLPRGFVDTNMPFANIGERHLWLWDFYQLKNVLEAAGFVQVKKMSFDTTGVSNAPCYELDAVNNLPRLGDQSMYVEALKRGLR
jgi:hypothetical protein